MSPWLLNIFFDRVVRRVNERTAGRRGKVRDENGGSWKIKQILYADNTMLVAESREHLQHIVNEFERTCDIMELKVNFKKGKGLEVKKNQGESVVRR